MENEPFAIKDMGTEPCTEIRKYPVRYSYVCSFFFVSERNYGSSIYAQQEALELGCQQVLWLYGEDHQITEVGTMNLFLYWINEDGGIVTHNMKTMRVGSWDHKAGIHILCTSLLEAIWTPQNASHHPLHHLSGIVTSFYNPQNDC